MKIRLAQRFVKMTRITQPLFCSFVVFDFPVHSRQCELPLAVETFAVEAFTVEAFTVEAFAVEAFAVEVFCVKSLSLSLSVSLKTILFDKPDEPKIRKTAMLLFQ